MSVSTHYSSPRSMLLAPLTSWFFSLRARFIRHQNYRRTLNELSALSSNQLADLGLNRSCLRQTAYQASYHQIH